LERCSNGRIDGFESDGLLIVAVDGIADPIKIMEIKNKIGPIMDLNRWMHRGHHNVDQ